MELEKRDKDNILEVLSCYSRKEIEIMNDYDLNMGNMKEFASFPKSYIANEYIGWLSSTSQFLSLIMYNSYIADKWDIKIKKIAKKPKAAIALIALVFASKFRK